MSASRGRRTFSRQVRNAVGRKGEMRYQPERDRCNEGQDSCNYHQPLPRLESVRLDVQSPETDEARNNLRCGGLVYKEYHGGKRANRIRSSGLHRKYETEMSDTFKCTERTPISDSDSLFLVRVEHRGDYQKAANNLSVRISGVESNSTLRLCI